MSKFLTRAVAFVAISALAVFGVVACNKYETACALKDVLYKDIQLYAAASGGISLKTQLSVDTAYRVATDLCNNPPVDNATKSVALIRIVDAGAQLAIAFKTIRAQGDAKGIAVPVRLERVMENYHAGADLDTIIEAARTRK